MKAALLGVILAVILLMLQEPAVSAPSMQQYAPDTIVVSTGDRRLYYKTQDGQVISFPVAVGRDGYTWGGSMTVTQKKEWPDWYPPSEMIERQPYLPKFMAGGPGNPLGARAMYLGNTLYRIHGSGESSTVGAAVSSGCFRMRNKDVISLYNLVRVGTKVVVLK
jgi:lipoprotein-anchoring transpeptidase ErfK/SrfK